ncbi:hypothetical protein JQC92_03720 [Shewanella sp. 202IG2-18]|uniref:hypothetical protein n=1 Tax=Parashewanella hymeniacidonis TaxID=2807618 RepID=UPI0019604CC3|nr:hypothetical protein [Parashewanella hymeniacidonis]MBM7071149.1 hypothetical protein [Parashewanella hymeniacidonis]
MNIKCSKLVLICLFPLTASATIQVNQLTALGNNQFMDSQGFVENYTCPAGGTPLVIYSTAVNNQTPIRSKDSIPAAYVAPNFKASLLTIPEIQQTDVSSKKYLTVRTRTPADAFIQFNLTRFDQQKFFVSSVQFPVPYLKSEKQGNSKKYVTQAYVQLDNNANGQSKSLPIRDYSFDLDYRLDVMANIQQLSGYFITWSQAGKWGTASDQKFTNVPYIFSSLVSEDDPNFYNGYGAWVCGATK